MKSIDIHVNLSPQESFLLGLFMKRLDFSHVLACTDGYGEPGSGDTEQAYSMFSVIRKVELALSEGEENA